ncbi:MAG: tRNA (adenosine(37)-N6)-threonylcarbamoyltransferase complex transferase subunit TsaD [Firmicutes bacterium]|nr:tRNA (adenosine(37)-N6)-threonylcarbamoyltransferase complex transferase subunit TsaD [Bacillota bacterium]
MRVLGIETSCDETSAAVVEDGRILGLGIVSQADVHRAYGGVVPELASRQHLAAIAPVVSEALEGAGMRAADLDLVAVTRGPGLVGALLVGLSFAKALAWRQRLPLVGVNHLLGHVWANALSGWTPAFPVLALLVSGGHTDLLRLDGPAPAQTRILGRTRDDAAGEAFDKVARMLGLGYPGGPAIEHLAREGDPEAVRLPVVARLRDSLDMSFSGLKTAAYDLVHSARPPAPADLAAVFQARVVAELVSRVRAAVERSGVRTVLVAGGVAANGALRTALAEAARRDGFTLHVPPPALCTDNGAMVAQAGLAAFAAGERADGSLEPLPSIEAFGWKEAPVAQGGRAGSRRRSGPHGA